MAKPLTPLSARLRGEDGGPPTAGSPEPVPGWASIGRAAPSRFAVGAVGSDRPADSANPSPTSNFTSAVAVMIL